MADAAATSGGGRGFRFWKKKASDGGSGGGGGAGKSKPPADASKTGCGGLFSRRAKGRRRQAASNDNAPIQQEAGNGEGGGPKSQSQQPPSTSAAAAAAVHIPFDDVELPDVLPAAGQHDCDGGGGGGSGGSSVHSICDEVVCVKVREPESAWVRPPVAAPVKAAAEAPAKPKLALSKMASKDGPSVQQKPQPPQKQPVPPPATGDKDGDQSREAEAEAERQRLAEMRFERKSVDMRSVKAKPGVKIEQSPQSEMWWNIVNKSLVGTGVFTQAAVCSLQSGGVFACNPADFAPTADQVAALRDNFHSPGAFAAAGFAIGGALYKVEPAGCTRDLLSAVNLQHTEGLLVTRSRTAMLLAGFTGARDQARETLGEMRDLFVSQGL